MQKIMVIEDDADTLEIITTILAGADYEVVSGTDVTAVYAIEKEPPALLLIDNWLSGEKTGHDICYQLKQNPATAAIPVILISGTINLEETARRCGANGFICKPFDVEELLQQVKAHMA
ncbi:MAG: response regulator [Bacteroidota bacterium]